MKDIFARLRGMDGAVSVWCPVGPGDHPLTTRWSSSPRAAGVDPPAGSFLRNGPLPWSSTSEKMPSRSARRGTLFFCVNIPSVPPRGYWVLTMATMTLSKLSERDVAQWIYFAIAVACHAGWNPALGQVFREIWDDTRMNRSSDQGIHCKLGW